METQTWLSYHYKFISAENITSNRNNRNKFIMST